MGKEYAGVAKTLRESGAKEMLGAIYRESLGKAEMDVVMGNPSCDQDSFIGSLTLALALKHVPVVNLSREVFECKGDLLAIIAHLGLSLDDLVFLETSGDCECFLRKGADRYPLTGLRLRATLVDHNYPRASLLNHDVEVESVIDHHPILKADTLYQRVRSMEVELNAGSCCSLVFRRIEQILGLDRAGKADPERCKYLALLAIPVLTDTNFLTYRTKEVDVRAVERILEVLGLSREEMNAFVKMLHKEQRNEHKVKSALILRMDYKSFDYPSGGKTFGISSVKYTFEDWVQRDGAPEFVRAVEKFIEENRHEFLFVNSKVSGKRTMYFAGKASGDEEAFLRTVLYGGGKLKKRAIPGRGESIQVYDVDPLLSRKLFSPKVCSYLAERGQS